MELISMVRLGIGLGLDLPWSEEVTNELIVVIQPAHIQEIVGKILTADERDYIRAKIIKKKLIDNKH
jgi:protein arginine kinase